MPLGQENSHAVEVVTWGEPEGGGDSSSVQALLSDVTHPVTHVQASERAFAAIRTDGQVVAWGHAEYGGDASRVQNQLQKLAPVLIRS